ncbi:zinc finger protein [Macleaya cordata]|uniref:Zinc finger protein n=1 Tax=Macleaya cordata TaxID=56857 RepID=A0A200QX45_MACCD|nr:zinc finger protein [Macleaya cordata]
MSNISVDNRSFSSDTNNGEEEEDDFKQQQLQDDLAHGSNSSGGPSTTTTNSTNSSSSKQPPPPPPAKKKRNLPGTPDPSADVIALSPTTLMATNRFVCEICNKGFQRDQNLQLHRRGHNLPWKLRQRTNNEIRKRVYVCPEPTCIHHNPARALGDLTGIKKHFSRKHGEKKWKCDKCSKKYAVPSDWKAHSKTCGTRDYKCDCGTIFSRRDSFITHRAFCDALAEGTNKLPHRESLMTEAIDQEANQQVSEFISNNTNNTSINHISTLINNSSTDHDLIKNPLKSLPNDLMSMPLKPLNMVRSMFSSSPMSTTTLFNGCSGTINGITQLTESAHMSATALLQKAAQMGATASSNNLNNPSVVIQKQSSFMSSSSSSSAMAGIDTGGGFTNQFLQVDPRDQIPSSHFFNTSADAESSVINDMGMFNGIFMDDNQQYQNHQFLKNMEQNEHNSSSPSMLLMQGRTVNSGLGMNRVSNGIRNPIGPSRFRNINNGGSGDVTTLDFLGIGGSKSLNLYEDKHHHQQQQQQQQQQRGLEFEGINNNQHRMQAGLHPNFDQQQQQLLHGHGHELMEKPIWDV